MRLLMISGANISAYGGDTVHTMEMAVGLAAVGVQVTLLCRGRPNWPKQPGVDVVGLPTTKNKYFAGLLWPVSVCLALIFLTIIRGYDTVFVRDSIYELPVILLLKILGQKVVLEVNAIVAEDLRSRGRAKWKIALSGWLQRKACLAASLLLPVTTSIALWLVKQGVPTAKVVVVPNAANPYLYRPMERRDAQAILGLEHKKKYFCFAGNLAAWQGGDAVIEAFERLVRLFPDTGLIIIGDGEARVSLKMLVWQLGLAEKVIFTGRLSYQRVPVYMNACAAGIGGGWYRDNLWLKKRFQCSGSSALKVFSYLSCGLPVIIPDIPDLASMIRREKCGLVVGGDQVQELADALRAILEHPRNFEEAGRRGRDLIEREANWEQRAALVVELIERARRGTGRKPYE